MTATAEPGSASPNDYVGEEMTLWEHLEELRSRLFKAAAALALGFVVGFAFNGPVIDVLTGPYCSLPDELRVINETVTGQDCALVFDDVLGAFALRIKSAAIVAVLLGGPFVFFQIWRFVTPGLRPVEKRYALPFLVLSQVLFALGGLFAYYVIPRGLEFLLGLGTENVVSLMNASRYLSFVLQSLIAFGVAFEYPLILAVLVLMGVLDSTGLKRYRRHAFFGSFVGAAIITPSQDPVTMVVMALPLALFYEACIVFARVVERRRSPGAA